jgi:ribosomal protein S18 acetylase RimI-like enzyme
MSETTTATTVRSAHLDDIPAVAQTLALAFQDDPIFAWCLPAAPRRAALLPTCFELFARAVVPHGASEVTNDGRGAALWVPEGTPPVAEEDSPGFESSIAAILGDDGDRTFALMAAMEDQHPSAPHRYLWFIGVHPSAQGRGIGSALLHPALSRCDADGADAYLEATSEHNRRLYERHGFEVIAELTVDGSPPMWPMWRSPRS